MSRILLFLIPFFLVACAPGSFGPNAPLFVTDAPTVVRPITLESAQARQLAATCLNSNGGEAEFQQAASDRHFGALIAAFDPSGQCRFFHTVGRADTETAMRVQLAACENRYDGCVALLVAEPNVAIPRGARTVPQGLSEWILTSYLSSTGYGAIAMSDGGAWSGSANHDTAEEAEQSALEDCSLLSEYTLVGAINRSTRVEPVEWPCRIINRRTPEGVNTPQILQ